MKKKPTDMNTSITQLRRKILELCTLEILSRGEIYTSDMLEELKEAELILAEGTLYPLLYKFRKANLVHVRSDITEPGPPKKYYSLTAEGLESLKKLQETWQSLVSSLALITSKHPAL